MKKCIILTALVLICLLTLSACGCKHETWNAADCVNPKTCAECGEAEGEALGHSWSDATCETPKTCSTCSLTEGEAAGHSWTDAACETPKTCSACGITEGEALGHSWLDATTETPKTCENCALTEGERIITDERFTTAATAELQGTWVYRVSVTGEDMNMPDLETVLEADVILIYGNDGSMSMHFSLVNEEAFKQAMLVYMTDTMYAEMESEGYDKAAADAAFQQVYGMTVEQYAAYALNTIDLSDLYGSINMNGVYYVENGMIYQGISWGAQMESTKFTLEGDTLTLHDDVSGTGEETSVFTRVTEE